VNDEGQVTLEEINDATTGEKTLDGLKKKEPLILPHTEISPIQFTPIRIEVVMRRAVQLGAKHFCESIVNPKP
jgi:hypothetical protein